MQGRALRGTVQQSAITGPQRFFDYRNVSAMTLLRRRRPVARIGSRTVVVTRREDVLAVLEDTETFPTPYIRGLAAGFVLGRTGQEFDRQRVMLSAALRADDLEELEGWASELASTCVANVGAGPLAVGSELVRPVVTGVVNRYLGVRGPDPETLMRWTRAMFQDIFFNNYELSVIQTQGEHAAQQLRASVRAAVDARQRLQVGPGGPGEVPDDVLTRLLAEEGRPHGQAVSQDEIVDNLIGLAIGWLWHGAKAALLAVDGLLDRPEALMAARSAAQTGDREHLRRVLWEVLRFRPVQVGLPRTCAHGAAIGEGTPYETEIPPARSSSQAHTPLCGMTASCLTPSGSIPPAPMSSTSSSGTARTAAWASRSCGGSSLPC